MNKSKSKRTVSLQNASSLFMDGPGNSGTSQPESTIVPLSDYESEAMELLRRGDGYYGVSTGYTEVDKRLKSFIPGELFTLGGDTGHGKSIFAMNIALNVYRQYKKPVLFVNMELTTAQAVQRFYNMSGDHDYAGILTQVETDLNYKDVDKLMKEAKEKEVALVIIDHLHFFNDSIGDNAASALTRVVKHFKQCAVKYELPVMLLSHVTPGSEPNGTPIRPSLHSLRGSRSIEQLSDIVGFVYRDPDDTKVIDFYVQKMRSRELDTAPVKLTQKGWRLLDWVPTE